MRNEKGSGKDTERERDSLTQREREFDTERESMSRTARV